MSLLLWGFVEEIEGDFLAAGLKLCSQLRTALLTNLKISERPGHLRVNICTVPRWHTPSPHCGQACAGDCVEQASRIAFGRFDDAIG